MSGNRNVAILSFGAVLIAFLGLNLFPGAGRGLLVPSANAAEPAKPLPPLPEMSEGKADAPVTVVEYSSLSCPHCAAFHKEVLPELKSKYIDTGKVKYVVKEFPLNDSALAGAVIARCLPADRYFPFVNLLFAKQDEWAYKEDALTPLKQLAKQAGMTDEEFNKCLDNETLQKQVLAVRDEGSQKGVHGTPTFFINGKKLEDAPTIESFDKAIQPYLKK